MGKKHFLLGLLVLFLTGACASIGSPDGGRFDETPPRVLSSMPKDGAVNVSAKKVQILFDEYVKLEKANEKVIVSPPQIETPNVRADSSRVRITPVRSLSPSFFSISALLTFR